MAYDSIGTLFTATARTGGAYSPAKPASTAGKRLFAVFAFDDHTVDPALTNADWIDHGAVSIAGPDGHWLQVFEVRNATGAESNSWTSGVDKICSAYIVAFSGRHATAPISFVNAGTNTSSNATPVTFTNPGGTAGAGDDLLLFPTMDQTVAGDRWSYSHTGYTSRGVAQQDWVGVACLTQDNVSAGSKTASGTATRTTGSGNAGWITGMAAIPAAATDVALGLASGAGTAPAPSVQSVQPVSMGLSSATAVAPTPSVQSVQPVSIGLASATATAPAPVVGSGAIDLGLAAATANAPAPTAQSVQPVSLGLAAAAGQAFAVVATNTVALGLAAATGFANAMLVGLQQPRVVSSGGRRGRGGGGRRGSGGGPLLLAALVATPNSVWSTLSVMSVVNPMDYGAAGDGIADDGAELDATVDALPAGGGIVYFPPGAEFRKTDSLVITKEHVKFWAPNRQSNIRASVSGNTPDTQSIRSVADGFGLFGVVINGDATARGSTADDHMVVGDNIDLFEVVGCEIEGSFATGIFCFGTTNSFIEGNFVHHTWADHIHHTFGTRDGWAWDNWIFNEGPSDGDDGIACVTYGGESSTGALEFWRNVHLGSGSGRGYTVVGGDSVNIHHNWAIGVAGAGVLIATEPAYTSEPVTDVVVQENWITGCGHSIGHAGILISALYGTNSIDGVDLIDNVSAGNVNGNYNAEGSYVNVSNTGLDQSTGSLPTQPTLASVAVKDTSILMTRDTSFVTAGSRPGLYRIHVRRHPSGVGFQQRFEYVVKGTPADVTTWVALRTAAGDYQSEQQTVSGTAYALLLCSAPVSLGTGVSAVTHAELRAGDQIGASQLSWLWARVNEGSY